MRVGHGAMGRGTMGALAFVSFVALAAATTDAKATNPDRSAAPTLPDGGPRVGDVAPPALEDVEDMCALLTSCDALPLPPSLVPQDFGACVRRMSDEMTSPGAINYSLTMRECGLRSNSCGELRSCALRGARPDVCVGRGKQSVAGYCDIDGRAITCWHEHVLAVRDCPRGNEQCAVREGEALCTLGACPRDMKDGAAPTCSPSGERILRCEKGRLVSLDCGAFGLQCAPTRGGAGCAPPTPTCSGGTGRCEGQVSVGCVNGHEVRVDCAASGLSCGGAGIAVGGCTSPAPSTGACDPNAPTRCDGANVKYCFAGKPRSYFCKSLGFGRCTVGAKGVRCAL